MLSREDLAALRRKDRNITWQPYLSNDAKQDILEIYERLDVEKKGYITNQQLHAALNEAFGKPLRAETVRSLATRMDITSRHGLKVTCNDFLEYMAQKLLSAESYEDLLRSEQGPLMQEAGYKIYELLERFKRTQMLKDAMAGTDGIQRLLHLTTAPLAQRNRRKGHTGDDLMNGEQSGAGEAPKGGSAVSSARSRHKGVGAAATASNGSAAARSVGDKSFASRSSFLSRQSTSSGGDMLSATGESPPLPAAAAAASGPSRRVAANARNGGRPAPPQPRSRQDRKPAGAAPRAPSKTLASMLSRAAKDGVVDLQLGGGGDGSGLVEDRGSSQRWRKGVSHSLAEAAAAAEQPAGEVGHQPTPTSEQLQQPQMHEQQHGQAQSQHQQHPTATVDVTVQEGGQLHTLNLVRPRSSNPSGQSSGTSSSTRIPSGSSHLERPGFGTATAAAAVAAAGGSPSPPPPAGGEASIWPQRRLSSHQTAPPAFASTASSASAATAAPRSSASTSAPAISVAAGPGRSSCPALSPLGSGHSLSVSPLTSGRVDGWRSAAILEQVLELERTDVHGQLMEDLRATVGLPPGPGVCRPQAARPSYQQQNRHQQLLHQLPSQHAQQQPQQHQKQRQPQQQSQLQQVPSLLCPQSFQQPHEMPHQQQQPQQHTHQGAVLHPTAPPSALPLPPRAHTFPRQGLEEEGGEVRLVRSTGGAAAAAVVVSMDVAGATSSASSGDAGEGGTAGPAAPQHRADSHRHASPPSPQQPRHHRQQQQQQCRQLKPTPQPVPPQPQSPPQLPRRPHSQPQQQPPPQQQGGGSAERRRGGGGGGGGSPAVGSWVTSDPEGPLGQLLRMSASSGGGVGSGGRFRGTGPRCQALLAPEPLRLEVSGAIECDPLLAKLPEWVRKGIGIPASPAVVQSVEPESGAQPLTLAVATSPLATAGVATASTATAVTAEPGWDAGAAAHDPIHIYKHQVGVAAGGGRSGGRISSSSIGDVSRSSSNGDSGGGSTVEDVGLGVWLSNPVAAPDAGSSGGGGYRMGAAHAYSFGRQSIGRFLPFGGDVAAVVAEEDAAEEGTVAVSAKGEALPRVAAAAAAATALAVGGLRPDVSAAIILSPRDESGLLRNRSSYITDGLASIRSIHGPQLVETVAAEPPSPPSAFGSAAGAVDDPDGVASPGTTWGVSGQLGHERPELIAPSVITFQKQKSTWPNGEGSGGGVECAEGGWPSAAARSPRDIEAMRESLSAWEASVLSRRSSVGHGSLAGSVHGIVNAGGALAERRTTSGGESGCRSGSGGEDGCSDGEDSDTVSLYRRLMTRGSESSGGRARRRAPAGPVARVLEPGLPHAVTPAQPHAPRSSKKLLWHQHQQQESPPDTPPQPRKERRPPMQSYGIMLEEEGEEMHMQQGAGDSLPAAVATKSYRADLSAAAAAAAAEVAAALQAGVEDGGVHKNSSGNSSSSGSRVVKIQNDPSSAPEETGDGGGGCSSRGSSRGPPPLHCSGLRSAVLLDQPQQQGQQRQLHGKPPRSPLFPTASRPVSAALLPSAVAIVAAAEAAVARASDEGVADGGAGGGSALWSAEYVWRVAKAGGRRPAVRLNHSAMLRMQVMYGAEMVAAAGAALGLGGGSAAAREAISRELLQMLGSSGGGAAAATAAGLPPCRSVPPAQNTAAAGGAAMTAWASMPVTSSPSWGRRCSGSSTEAAGAATAVNGPPQNMLTCGSVAPAAAKKFLPHDAVGLGRQIMRQASANGSRRSSESDATVAAVTTTAGGNGSATNRPAINSNIRAAANAGAVRATPAGAAPAAAFAGPVHRPASARPPRIPSAATAAADPRLRGLSASALSPTSHVPRTASIGRVWHMDESDVTCCFRAALPKAGDGGGGGGSGGPRLGRNARLAPPAPPANPPATPPIAASGTAAMTQASGRRSPGPGSGVNAVDAGGSTGSCENGDSVSGGDEATSAPPSSANGPVGSGEGGVTAGAAPAATEGSGVAVEERPRRQLEVMGSATMLARKGSSADAAAAGMAIRASDGAAGGKNGRLMGMAARGR